MGFSLTLDLSLNLCLGFGGDSSPLEYSDAAWSSVSDIFYCPVMNAKRSQRERERERWRCFCFVLIGAITIHDNQITTQPGIKALTRKWNFLVNHLHTHFFFFFYDFIYLNLNSHYVIRSFLSVTRVKELNVFKLNHSLLLLN